MKRLASRCQGKYWESLVLDTSYVLPFLGVQVKGVDAQQLIELFKGFHLYYPATLLAELEGVVFKELRRKGLVELPSMVLEGFDSLIHGGEVEVLSPTSLELKVIYDVVKEGWRDLFDAAAYAAAVRVDGPLLTMDMEFKTFLDERGFDSFRLLSHKELPRLR